MYPYIGMIGWIGVGYSAGYAWQTVFNTFGALAIATELYGLKGAVSLRLIQNIFGVVFTLLFFIILHWFVSRIRVKEVL